MNRRNFITRGLLAGTLGIGVASGIGANMARSLPASIDIVTMNDRLQVQRLSSMDIRIENEGSEPFSPMFSTIRQQLQTRFYWNQAPQRVAPGESKIYRITAPNMGAAIPYEDTFLLAIEDQTADNGLTRILTAESSNELAPVRNPSLSEWQESPPLPARWGITREAHGSDHTSISQSDHGATFEIRRGDDSGVWTMAGLVQQTSRLERIELTAIPQTLTTPGGFPTIASGLEIIDRQNRIWLVFADVDSRRSVRFRNGGLDYHITYAPATVNEQTTVELDIADIYNEYNWSEPPSQPLAIDGFRYTASTMFLHPFTAVYPQATRTENAMTLCEISVPESN